MTQQASTSTAIEYITSQNWALQPEVMSHLSDVLERHFNGIKLPADQIEAIVAARDGSSANDRKFEVTRGGTAIIPVSGIIAKHSRLVNGSSQPKGTSVETMRQQLADAMADRTVTQIMLHIESPGGNVNGLADFAQSVFDATFSKPVVAFIDDLGASAAYWIAAGANKIFTNVTGNVGSIGVYCLYVDSSARAEKLGLKYMIFRSGANKGIGSPGVEITEGNAAAIQENIDGMFEVFLSAVLKGRAHAGLGDEQLRAVADGRCFVGAVAQQHNLVDGVMTFDQALAALETNPPALRTENTIAAADVAEQNETIQNKELDMAEKKEAAAITQEVLDAAVKAEGVRLVSINEALAGDEYADIRQKAAGDTAMTVAMAKAEAFGVAIATSAAKIKAIEETLAEANEKLETIAKGGSNAVAAVATDKDEDKITTDASDDDGKASTFTAARDKLVAEGKTTTKAISGAVAKYPKSYDAWVLAQQENRPQRTNRIG